ncbi:hypothetical protein TSUD_281930 [Trifolium subterraneum]|uniref:Transposase (putative) gypsy type domain-containing protein n=1 Tax=Trifolium subterraneum TaxID=3900 RepID=A0A2Z6LVC2_TRISU|nr:hypothetical protein TSUD_281930 [Trifolium subterraneum]
MAVGKRLRSRDEHLMLIIPLSSVTNCGDSYADQWSGEVGFMPLGLARQPKGGSLQRVSNIEVRISLWCQAQSDVEEGQFIGLVVGASRFVEEKCSKWVFVFMGKPNEIFDAIFSRVQRDLRIDGCDLDGQVVSSSSATCKGYSDSTQVLLRSNGLDDSGVLSFRAGVMAEEQAPASTSNSEEDELAWLADEPRTTISKFSLIGGDGMFRTVQRPPLDDWKARIPNTSRRICSKFQWGFFPMYQIAFEHMGYRLPFSDFEVAVFRYLHLTPSQLHPNSLAFIRAFEMTAVYLGFLPTIPLFFHAFHLQRSRPKGDAANKFSWVSLKQSVKLFEMFLESVRGFKDSYFFVKPLNSVAWKSVIYRGPTKDYSLFPLSWRKSHYLKPASDFVYSAEELTVEELSNYEQLKVFVSGFPRKYYEDEEGNPVLDEMGFYSLVKTWRRWKHVFVCSLGSKASKEKKQAAVLGSSSTTAPPPTPGGDNTENARGTAVIVDLEDVGGNVEHQARPPKVARVDEINASATGRIPSTASRFVLPPAIGSPELVKKSFVALSDAEKPIMDDMGPEALKNELTDAMVAALKLMEISSFLNGRECKYLADRDAAKKEVCLLTQRLKQIKVNHAAYKEKYKLQVGLLTKLDENEAEVARLTTEKEELEGQVKDLTTEKETLEGKVKELESMPCSSAAAPDANELVVDPNGEYKGFTRAALVSRIFELEAQQLDIAKSSFDNVVAQLMVLNPGVDLVVAGASELMEVDYLLRYCSSNNYGCFLMSRIVSTVPEQFVELHECLACSQTRVEESFVLESFLAALNIPSRAGHSAGHVLSNDGARMECSLIERGCQH